MHIKPEKQNSLSVLIMGMVFVMIGLIFFIAPWGAYIKDSKIQDSGSIAEGHIVKKTFLFVTDGDSDYILEYWFATDSGNIIKTSHHVNKSFWNSVSEKQIIEIKYSSSNPERNFPISEGSSSLGMTLFISILGALLSLFGSTLILGYFRNLQNA